MHSSNEGAAIDIPYRSEALLEEMIKAFGARNLARRVASVVFRMTEDEEERKVLIDQYCQVLGLKNTQSSVLWCWSSGKSARVAHRWSSEHDRIFCPVALLITAARKGYRYPSNYSECKACVVAMNQWFDKGEPLPPQRGNGLSPETRFKKKTPAEKEIDELIARVTVTR